jgi:molybdopterin synthase catalytic subunit
MDDLDTTFNTIAFVVESHKANQPIFKKDIPLPTVYGIAVL